MAKSQEKYIYVMQCKQYVKFGVSMTPDARIKELQTGNLFEIKLMLKLKYEDHYQIENRIHKYFNKQRGIGEWFLIDEDIKKFVKYLKNIEWELSKR